MTHSNHIAFFLLVFLVAVLTVPNTTYAQNLVPNPSFELYSDCPDGLFDLTLETWNSPSLANPDYFNGCAVDEVGVPSNVFGHQEANTGSAYVGMHIGSPSNDYREYIQCELDSCLEAGVAYEVKVYVSLADSASVACNQIGVGFSYEEIDQGSNGPLMMDQVLILSESVILEKGDWVLLCDTVIVDQAHCFLSLGVFGLTEELSFEEAGTGWQGVAHYYYDDISVVRVNPVDIDDAAALSASFQCDVVGGMAQVSCSSQDAVVSLCSAAGELHESLVLSAGEIVFLPLRNKSFNILHFRNAESVWIHKIIMP